MSVGAKITVSIDDAETIKRRHGLAENGPIQQEFTHMVRQLSDPYVPLDKSPLKNTAVEDGKNIIYVQPYADKNYRTNKGRGTEGTAMGGKRGAYWDKRMWADRGPEVVKYIAGICGGKPK